jgi:hypothetical protein
MYYNLIFGHVCANVVAVEKKYLTHPEFVLLALGTLPAMRICHVIICGLIGYTKSITSSHERHDVHKKT